MKTVSRSYACIKLLENMVSIKIHDVKYNKPKPTIIMFCVHMKELVKILTKHD